MQRYGSIPSSPSGGDAAPGRAAASPSVLARLFLSAGGALVDASSSSSPPRHLEFSDLLPLEPEDTAAASLARVYAAEMPLEDLSPRGALRGVWRAHGATLVWCTLGHAFTAGAMLLAPVLVQRVVLALDGDPAVETAPLRNWLVAFLAIRVLAVLVDTHVFLAQNHVALRLMAALRSGLFRKAMRTQLYPAASAGLDVSTLATSDASCCLAAVQQLTKLAIVPVQILVTTYLLYTVLDLAAFPGVFVIVLSLTTNYRIAHMMSNAYGNMMRLRDARMRTVHEAFGAMQHVKVNAWEPWFQNKLFQQRDRELAELTRFVYAAAANTLVLWGAPLAVSLVSFAFYALVLGRELTAATVFTAIALFNVLQGPLQDAPTIVQSLLQARVSLNRIRTYLSEKERDPISVNHVQTATYAIDVQDASFAWNEDTPLALRGLTLRLRPGEFALVTGDVGAGKTALCLALLGELPRRGSSPTLCATVAGTVAYVSQTPWIQHASLRDNILFGRDFDAPRYRRVVHACCLDEDFALFPVGDRTEIGERGVNLSGGQKMRLALARACYADADVYVLDAPLAPVDGPVQRQLVERCLGALLATKTVVLTSHDAHDVLTELGVVDLHVHLRDGVATTSRTKRDPASRPVIPLKTLQDRIASESPPPLSQRSDAAAGQLVVDEARERGEVSGRVYTDYLRAVGGRGALALLVALQLLWQLCQISGDVWLSVATERRSVSSTRIVAVYALLATAAAAMVALRGLVVSRLGLRASRTLFHAMVRGLLHAPLRFFETTPIGRVLNRFVDDVLVLDRSVPTSLGLFLGVAASTACALLTAAVGIGPAGALLLLPLTALYLAIARRCVVAFCELMRLRKLGLAPILSHLAQSQRGVATLRAFGDAHVARAARAFEALVDRNSTLWHSEIVLNQWFIQRLQFLGCAALAVVLGAVYAARGTLSAGAAGLVLTYTLRVSGALTTLVRAWARSENAMVSVERVLAFGQLDREGEDKARSTTAPPALWPAQGEIAFEHVRLAYSKNSDGDDGCALRDVSFRVCSGESIGVIGRTGAGKSSLVVALLRLHELRGGRICVDGVDIARVPLARLRRKIAVIPQSPVLLEGSVRDFLDPEGVSGDTALLLALEHAQLTAVLRTLQPSETTSGTVLDVSLRAEGDNLSVGQRQLLCLARVLLRRAQIVVLDEATAAVDAATERCLTETLARELRGATRITIAHRLATVRHADRILVLEQGRVVAFDAPHALAANTSDGTVAALLQGMREPPPRV